MASSDSPATVSRSFATEQPLLCVTKSQTNLLYYRNLVAGSNRYNEEVIEMKKNVGGVDRITRVVAGFGILSLAFIGPQSPWAYLGLVPLLTGIVGWCPPYQIMGFSTCSKCR